MDQPLKLVIAIPHLAGTPMAAGRWGGCVHGQEKPQAVNECILHTLTLAQKRLAKGRPRSWFAGSFVGEDRCLRTEPLLSPHPHPNQVALSSPLLLSFKEL